MSNTAEISVSIKFSGQLEGDTFSERAQSLAACFQIKDHNAVSWLASIGPISVPGARKWLNGDATFRPMHSSLDKFIDNLYESYELPLEKEGLKQWLITGELSGLESKSPSQEFDKGELYLGYLIVEGLGYTFDTLSTDDVFKIYKAAKNYYEQEGTDEEDLKLLIKGMKATFS